MFEVTDICSIEKVDSFVWNVVFEMDGHQEFLFTTDLLYLQHDQKWVVNRIVPHEPASLLRHTCPLCGENKMSCGEATKHYKAVYDHLIRRLLNHQHQYDELQELPGTAVDRWITVNKKDEWQQLFLKNR
ncbi:hypothetical protein [Desertibacillus haloalkaliphilus]|uniref:hypothetical protein n=1 Tax=Desertibacillus haloalkaliphilus TaxID=1328930 RepID=UPI001C261BE4|nr:hypothetical protein [Desertibacillus haloalkaliphilus]MBU8905118.1 hypothetical protein [Desertibacillus haloalkaliphilus]